VGRRASSLYQRVACSKCYYVLGGKGTERRAVTATLHVEVANFLSLFGTDKSEHLPAPIACVVTISDEYSRPVFVWELHWKVWSVSCHLASRRASWFRGKKVPRLKLCYAQRCLTVGPCRLLNGIPGSLVCKGTENLREGRCSCQTL
jgi:hypothetical protein